LTMVGGTLLKIFFAKMKTQLLLLHTIIKKIMERSIESLEQKLGNMEILINELIAKLEEKEKTSEEELGNMDDCSRWLKRSPSTIYKLTSQKRIPHFRNGKRLLFKKAEVLAWVEKDRQQTVDHLISESDQDLQQHAKSPWKAGIYK